ncbi:MAG TPA: type II secretion system protein GspG [Planctomycetota bacterium]|nr:type II secretion system protein GspG [Planctomycetota bacterium]
MAGVTWPLLRLRRRNEIWRTHAILGGIEGSLEQFWIRYGTYPETLREEPRDAWGRPIQYRNPGIHNPKGVDLWSLGPDPDDPSDDLGNWSNSGSP